MHEGREFLQHGRWIRRVPAFVLVLFLCLLQGCESRHGTLGTYEPSSPEVATRLIELLKSQGAEEVARTGPNPPGSDSIGIVNLIIPDQGIELSISLVPGSRLAVQVAAHGRRARKDFRPEDFLNDLKVTVEGLSDEAVSLTVYH